MPVRTIGYEAIMGTNETLAQAKARAQSACMITKSVFDAKIEDAKRVEFSSYKGQAIAWDNSVKFTEATRPDGTRVVACTYGYTIDKSKGR